MQGRTLAAVAGVATMLHKAPRQHSSNAVSMAGMM
jgi:hypothetical protein